MSNLTAAGPARPCGRRGRARYWVRALDSRQAPEVRVSRVFPASPERVWQLVADPRNHERWIPLTRVVLTRDEPRGGEPIGMGVGTLFTAYSGPGARRGRPVGLPDRMIVTKFLPPAPEGSGVYRKLGPLLLGEAAISVKPVTGGSSATWSEQVYFAGPLPRALTGAVAAPFLHAMLVLALRRAAVELARTADAAA
ncbi:MAG: SRPBCC family protein [Candidatus Nanopelagicales bacterium]